MLLKSEVGVSEVAGTDAAISSREIPSGPTVVLSPEAEDGPVRADASAGGTVSET